MQRKKAIKQRGFTLIELLIAALLLAIIALAALGLVVRMHARLAERAEAEELEERRSQVLDNLRYDFELAGHQILPPQIRVRSQEAVYLPSDVNYQTENWGYCRKLTNSNATSISARGLYASGWLQYRPQYEGSGRVGFRGRNSVIALTFQPREGEIPAQLTYYQKIGGTETASPIEADYQAGDNYRLALEAAGNNVLVKAYRIRVGIAPVLMRTLATIEADYPYQPYIELERTGATIENLLLSGASIGVVRTGEPLLPVDTRAILEGATTENQKRLQGAVQIKTVGGVFESVTLLRGDPNTDATNTIEDVGSLFASTVPQTLIIQSPCNGGYEVGDIVMLIDATTPLQRTALYRIMAPAPMIRCNAAITLKLERVSEMVKAWSRLYSLATDYNEGFPARKTHVVRLSSPVTYRLDSTTLIRVERQRQITLARGVDEFAVTPQNSNGMQRFEIKCRMHGEGFTTILRGDTIGHLNISYVASPQTLNQSYEYQQLGSVLE